MGCASSSRVCRGSDRPHASALAMTVLRSLKMLLVSGMATSASAQADHGCRDKETVTFRAERIKAEPTRPMSYKNDAGQTVVVSSNGIGIIAKIPEDSRGRVATFARKNQSCVIAVKYGEEIIKKELSKVVLPLSSAALQDDAFVGVVLNEGEIDQSKRASLVANRAQVSLTQQGGPPALPGRQ